MMWWFIIPLKAIKNTNSSSGDAVAAATFADKTASNLWVISSNFAANTLASAPSVSGLPAIQTNPSR